MKKRKAVQYARSRSGVEYWRYHTKKQTPVWSKIPGKWNKPTRKPRKKKSRGLWG